MNASDAVSKKLRLFVFAFHIPHFRPLLVTATSHDLENEIASRFPQLRLLFVFLFIQNEHRKQYNGKNGELLGGAKRVVALPVCPARPCPARQLFVAFAERQLRPVTGIAHPALFTVSRENLIEAAKVGRVAGHSREARARQAEKQRRHAAALRAWQPSDKPDWLNEETYRAKIQPRLAAITVPVISAALGISQPYAAEIRAGRYRPHRRHWLTLARLVGVEPDE